jgi:hypothetical protein
MEIRRRLIQVIPSGRIMLAFCLLPLFVVFLAPAAAWGGDFTSGLLWRIEAAGVTPSHLFGTIHSEDERVVTLAAPVREAFDDASSVTLEITMDPAALITASLAMMLTDGRTLKDIVGDALYQKTVRALADYSVPEMMAAQLKPWAAATTLSMPKPATGLVLDMALYQEAVAAGKPVDGLETVDEQLKVFDDMEERHQTAMLRDAVEHLPEVRAELQALLEAWLDRDLAGLETIGEKSMQRADEEFIKMFEQNLIVNRNHRMAERMQERLKKGGAFIAVGALHLPGEDGLLNLLEKRGYRVTRVW